MQICHKKVQLSIMPGTWLLFSVCTLFIPLKWLLAWFLAATMHELSHLAVLHFYKAKIYRIQIGTFGAQIQTEPLSRKVEFISACAGPLCGTVLATMGQWIPRIAICALFQTLCNLIPYKNHDGGRILRCLLCGRISEKRCGQILTVIDHLCRLLCLIAACWVGWHLSKVFSIYVALFYFVRSVIQTKIPCKQRKQIVQ